MHFATSLLCLLFGAVCLHYSFAVSTRPVCKKIACRCLNPNVTTDIYGCKKCSCLPKPPLCPKLNCLNRMCPNGFKRDKNGCQTCTCNPTICPQISCPSPLICQSEYFRDASGCQKCRCKRSCPKIACPLIKCAFGYATKNGCPVCQCRTSILY